MQADGRLIEHVKHTTQVRTKLSRQTNSLRFTTAQGFGGAAESEITETDVFHETQPLLNFRQQFRSNGLCHALKTKFAYLLERLSGRKRGKLLNRPSLDTHMPRDGVQARTMATRTLVRFFLIDPLKFTIGGELVFQN